MNEPRTRSLSGKEAELPSRVRLLARNEGGELARLELARGKVTVGSAPDNDLVLKDDTVSRHHLELSTRGGALWVKDLGSKNGTRYQGLRIAEAFVPLGGALMLGQVELLLEPGGDRAPVSFGELESVSPPMIATLRALQKVAPLDTTVLIEAESGSGKELAARALHQASPRAKGPFETLDCGALAENLAASQLFGHVKGAFTGADRARPGAFERADGGTLFIDEVGELPLELQPLLLRALERHEVRRVGDEQPRPVDVRVVAATHQDLDAQVRARRFREDLFHRLAVVRVRIPPLRERLEDLPLLVRALLDRLGASARGFALSEQTLARLRLDKWAGNVRELRNVVERAVALGEVVRKDEPKETRPKGWREAREEAIQLFEREYALYLLRTFDGNVSKAAREAGIDRVYLHKLIRKHDLEP